MNRRVMAAVAALVLAAVGTFGLVSFVRGAEQRALAGEQVVDVLVVQSRVSAGTAAADLGGRVSVEQVPAKVQADGAVTDVSALEGLVAAVDLLPGEQLTRARFIEPDALARFRAQVEVPEDLLEVTVSLSPDRAIGGVIRPGSTVAVLASFDPFNISSVDPVELEGVVIPDEGQTPNSTHLILHKVLVTNVQTEQAFRPDDDEEESVTARAPTTNLLVTLALDAPSVERLVFTAEHGRIWLALEPEEAPETGTRVQTRGSVYE